MNNGSPGPFEGVDEVLSHHRTAVKRDSIRKSITSDALVPLFVDDDPSAHTATTTEKVEAIHESMRASSNIASLSGDTSHASCSPSSDCDGDRTAASRIGGANPDSLATSSPKIRAPSFLSYPDPNQPSDEYEAYSRTTVSIPSISFSPNPWFVIKAKNEDEEVVDHSLGNKVFINVCYHDQLPALPRYDESDLDQDDDE